LRDGKRRTLHAKVEEPELKAMAGDKLHPRLAGAVLANLAEETVHGKVQGVVVAEVAPSSPALLAGLRKGDVIVQANRQEVTDLDSLRSALKGHEALLLNIRRGGGALFLLLQ
jgi:S1-C subfamily serine protease